MTTGAENAGEEGPEIVVGKLAVEGWPGMRGGGSTSWFYRDEVARRSQTVLCCPTKMREATSRGHVMTRGVGGSGARLRAASWRGDRGQLGEGVLSVPGRVLEVAASSCPVGAVPAVTASW